MSTCLDMLYLNICLRISVAFIFFNDTATTAIFTISLLNSLFFFFNDTATTEIYTLSLHDALPISSQGAIAACNKYAASEAGSKDKTMEVVKDGAIGAVVGAAVGAAGGAIAGGGKGEIGRAHV